MRIKEFCLRKVRGLPEIHLSFVDQVTGQVRQRTVIAGSNGTGKTTILEAICALASLLLDQEQKPIPSWLLWHHNSASWISLTGLEMTSLPPADLVIFAVNYTRDLHAMRCRLPQDGSVIKFGYTSMPDSQPVDTSVPTALTELVGRIRASQRSPGKTGAFPNFLYFPSERRELQTKRKGQVVAESDGYEWVYHFSDSTRWEGSMESYLVALDYQDLMAQREGRSDADRFTNLVQIVNRFLQGKRIAGVQRTSFRVLIRSDDGQEFSIDSLSSGEKQILLMLVEIQRRIRQGSIVLIDEPEIHLHPRWQRLVVRALSDLCNTYNAQLIMTTHSQEIADAVYEHELVLLDDIFAEEKTG
jgi:predicted ATPase